MGLLDEPLGYISKRSVAQCRILRCCSSSHQSSLCSVLAALLDLEVGRNEGDCQPDQALLIYFGGVLAHSPFGLLAGIGMLADATH